MEPCLFGEGKGEYNTIDELAFGLMFHGFDYPDETGDHLLRSRFWRPIMRRGVIEFPRPEDCRIRKEVRPMKPKGFMPGRNYSGLQEEGLL